MSTSIRVEYKNISTRAELKNSMFIRHDISIKTNVINKSCEIITMKQTEKYEKIVLALSSALTTCLLLLQCYSILALKIMRKRSQLSISRWKQYCRETTPLLDSKE